MARREGRAHPTTRAVTDRPDTAAPSRTALIVLVVLSAPAAVLYVTLLVAASQPLESGDAAFGQGVEALFLTTALWIFLAIMLLIGCLSGAVSRRTGIFVFFLVPLSAVAAFAAVDMCSRHISGAIVFPALMPLLMVFYAFWARLPRLQARMPARETSAYVWGGVLVLAVTALAMASA
jgi:hypothetical protein